MFVDKVQGQIIGLIKLATWREILGEDSVEVQT